MRSVAGQLKSHDGVVSQLQSATLWSKLRRRLPTGRININASLWFAKRANLVESARHQMQQCKRVNVLAPGRFSRHFIKKFWKLFQRILLNLSEARVHSWKRLHPARQSPARMRIIRDGAYCGHDYLLGLLWNSGRPASLPLVHLVMYLLCNVAHKAPEALGKRTRNQGRRSDVYRHRCDERFSASARIHLTTSNPVCRAMSITFPPSLCNT